jgi:Tat protein translocase TatB subunit
VSGNKRAGNKLASARAVGQCKATLLPAVLGSIMNHMGFSETIFLFLLALLIFGPKKLPEIARQVGKALNEFKRASNEFKSQLASEISQLEMESQRQILPPAEPPAGSVAKLPEPVPPVETAVEPDSEMKVAPDA